MANNKYIIITPVRDEVRFVEKVIKSVVNQTIPPSEWILVDDGSTDGTSEIIDRWAGEYDWIQVIHRTNRGFRYAGGGVMEAFYAGYDNIRCQSWKFIVKLDADLSFEKNYFERCFAHFESDFDLGIGGGMVCCWDGAQLKEESMGDPPFHVRGATKIYRRKCWDQISPIMKAPGWDTIDEVKANMLGWVTRTFRDLKVIQNKATGMVDGNWRNWFKNGRANYITGYHPIFMMGKCFKRAIRKPFLLQSLALWSGFCSGHLKGMPRVQERAVIQYLRQQQIRYMLMRPSIYSLKL